MCYSGRKGQPGSAADHSKNIAQQTADPGIRVLKMGGEWIKEFIG